MSPIPRRYAHFLFGVIQSGITSAIAAAVASGSLLSTGLFFRHWLESWLLSLLFMLPIVIFAAPFIRKLTFAMTRPDASQI
jgi:hypothetical protein